MIKRLEKIAKQLIVFSLCGLIMACILPEPASSSFTVQAVVSSAMVSCTTPLDTGTNSFGDIDNTAVYSATTSTTTVSSSGTIYMKVYDNGSGASPGLWKNPDLIESPWATTTDATATLSINMEGYGIMATTSGPNLVINTRYDRASSTNIVGALEQGIGNAVTVASSSSATNNEVVRVDYKVAVAVTTPGGTYQDTVFYQCSTN